MLSSKTKRELKIDQRQILIDSIEIGIPSTQQILTWGERMLPNGKKVGLVKNSKTVNYKRFTPFRDGLFCERIFGPVTSFVCACGKKQPHNKVTFCEKCEVEYIDQRSRRYRLGYISLLSPVTHIWYLKGRPSYLSLFLGKRKKTIVALAYCNAYLIEHGISKRDNNLQISDTLLSMRSRSNTKNFLQDVEKTPFNFASYSCNTFGLKGVRGSYSVKMSSSISGLNKKKVNIKNFISKNKKRFNRKFFATFLTNDIKEKEFSLSTSYGTRFYARQHTLPFLPTLISHFYLRDVLLNFTYSSPDYNDIPLVEYCSTKRREPLQDVHKFMAHKTVEYDLSNFTQFSKKDLYKKESVFKGLRAYKIGLNKFQTGLKVSSFFSTRSFLKKSYPLQILDLHGPSFLENGSNNGSDFKKQNYKLKSKSDFLRSTHFLVLKNKPSTSVVLLAVPLLALPVPLLARANLLTKRSFVLALQIKDLHGHLQSLEKKLRTAFATRKLEASPLQSWKLRFLKKLPQKGVQKKLFLANRLTKRSFVLASPKKRSFQVSRHETCLYKASYKGQDRTKRGSKRKTSEASLLRKRAASGVLLRSKASKFCMAKSLAKPTEEPKRRFSDNVPSTIETKSCKGTSLSGLELTAIREILSYTGGGALQQLLQQFDQHDLCKFLFAEAQILRVLYEMHLANFSNLLGNENQQYTCVANKKSIIQHSLVVPAYSSFLVQIKRFATFLTPKKLTFSSKRLYGKKVPGRAYHLSSNHKNLPKFSKLFLRSKASKFEEAKLLTFAQRKLSVPLLSSTCPTRPPLQIVDLRPLRSEASKFHVVKPTYTKRSFVLATRAPTCPNPVGVRAQQIGGPKSTICKGGRHGNKVLRRETWKLRFLGTDAKQKYFIKSFFHLDKKGARLVRGQRIVRGNFVSSSQLTFVPEIQKSTLLFNSEKSKVDHVNFSKKPRFQVSSRAPICVPRRGNYLPCKSSYKATLCTCKPCPYLPLPRRGTQIVDLQRGTARASRGTARANRRFAKGHGTCKAKLCIRQEGFATLSSKALLLGEHRATPIPNKKVYSKIKNSTSMTFDLPFTRTSLQDQILGNLITKRSFVSQIYDKKSCKVLSTSPRANRRFARNDFRCDLLTPYTCFAAHTLPQSGFSVPENPRSFASIKEGQLVIPKLFEKKLRVVPFPCPFANLGFAKGPGLPPTGHLQSEALYKQGQASWGTSAKVKRNQLENNFGAKELRSKKEKKIYLTPDELQSKVNDLRKKQIIRISKRIYKIARRLKVTQLLTRNHRRPEWMILSHLPVLPPDLRPILQMSEKVIVASDLNIMYQRVIYRNNRHLRVRFIDFHLVTAIQRLVQDAVDRLIENGKGGSKPYYTQSGRPLKSLSDILKGKKGRFRLNLLGKRVDFSGRSVIVVSPSCKIHECGLPKDIALELYHYFLLRQLIVKKYCASIVTAKKMIKSKSSLMWDILRELMYHHPVLLNRAPTLHRLGIQAFQPKLVLGNAILLHPLVCSGFNADFDGDQMGVHLPLSFAARAESWDLLWSRNNLLSPATGQPMLVPSQDMVLGFYYITAQSLQNFSSNSNPNISRNDSPAQTSPNLVKRVRARQLKTKLDKKSKNLYNKNKRFLFLSTQEITTTFQKGGIKLHTPVWLHWNGKIENEDISQIPLELRVDSFGKQQFVYEKYIYSNFFTKDRNENEDILSNFSVGFGTVPKEQSFGASEINLEAPLLRKSQEETRQLPYNQPYNSFSLTKVYKPFSFICTRPQVYYVRTTAGRILMNNLLDIKKNI